MAVIIITAGTQITLPSDWNPSNNSIEVIGGGRGGGLRTATASGLGGTGAGYAKITNFGSAGQSLTINIGAGSLGNVLAPAVGGNTWVSNTGSAPTTTSQGVLANGGGSTTTRVGNTTFAGGTGGGAYNSTTNDNGGGGGGAGGPTGAGNNGTAGNISAGQTGGSGSAGNGGAGGTLSGGAGGNGSQWTATTNAISGTGLTVLAAGGTAGAGGGGGGGTGGAVNTTFRSGGSGGLYGGGGGGGSYNSAAATNYNGGTGGNGVIVLTYTPVIPVNISGTASSVTQVGRSYSQQNTASSGTAPYTYSVSAGSLPAGTSLNTSTGLVSGTPTTAGAFSYTVKVTDSLGSTATVATSGTIYSALSLSATNSSITQAGKSYSQANTVSGGVGTYTYAVSAGSLPTGTSLNTSTGLVSGTPSVTGAFSYTIRVTDGQSTTATASVSGTIAGAINITATPSTLNQVGKTYSQQNTTTGGTAPFTYSIESGTLPTGTSLNTSTGLVSGTPTVAGSFTYTVKVVDSQNTADTVGVTAVILPASDGNMFLMF